MDFIDQIYYINLDYRVDRKLQIEDWLEESNFPMNKVTRITAISTPGNGVLGCALSHIKTLEEFLSSSYNTCLILEDDYVPNDIKSFWSNFQKLKESNIKYDIVLCSYNLLDYDEGPCEFLKKVNKSFTTSSYLINRNFAPKLLENLKEGVQKKTNKEAITKKKEDEFSLDVYWQKLMPLSDWYCFYPRIGKQSESYSDIQGHYTNYHA
jgi:GR25 family glycosyltransferase involved in LPS biosynthesis